MVGGDAREMAPACGFKPESRLEGEVGHGPAMFGGGFTGTPSFGSGLSDGGAREYRLGWRLPSAAPDDPRFGGSLDATRKEPANPGTGSGAGGSGAQPEHGMTLRAVMWR